MSYDQTAETPSEVMRLRSEHPDERDVVSRGRVLGRLQPSRAFGDGRYKWTKAQAEVLQRSSRGTTPPYVTSRPEVLFHPLPQQDASFVILACDGVWDVMSSEEAVALVHAALQADPDSALNCAGQLVREALQRYAQWGQMTANELMSVRSPRHYRDDLTAMVVMLRPPHTGEDASGDSGLLLPSAPDISLVDVFNREAAAAEASVTGA